MKKKIATITVALSMVCGAFTKDKKVVFVAGSKSHGYFSHEHIAGCKLLAKHLDEAKIREFKSKIEDIRKSPPATSTPAKAKSKK